jgi:hypothetical protein
LLQGFVRIQMAVVHRTIPCRRREDFWVGWRGWGGWEEGRRNDGRE